MNIGDEVYSGQIEDKEYYQGIVDKFNLKYGSSILTIEDVEHPILGKSFKIVVAQSIDIDYQSAFDDVVADVRFNNPDNPDDTKYPFLRKEFVEQYEKAQKYGVTYTEYRKGFLEGKFVEPAKVDTPFRLKKSEEERKGNIQQRDDGSCYIAYYDSDGTLERIYSAPKEAAGLSQTSRLFFEAEKEGYQILVDEFNKTNGENIAQILGNGKGGYHVYMDPNWTSSPEFYRTFLNLENAIALDFHPNLTKAELLSYIQSEEMRQKYMESPSRELLLDIFRSQTQDKKITPAAAAKSALEGTSATKADEADCVEQTELNPENNKENNKEGETVDD